MKAMDYQLQNIKEQANDIENHFKRADKELQAFDEHLKNEQNRILLQDIKAKMKVAKQKAD
jgi:hypothetical protein